MNITGYNLKGFIGFWIVVILLLIALFSGEFAKVGWILLLLIGGMILYQIIRFAMRSTIGYDPHEGTTRSERKLNRSLEELARREREITVEFESIDDPADQVKFLESIDDPPQNLVIRAKEKLKSRSGWKCSICKKVFAAKTALDEHKKAKHKKK